MCVCASVVIVCLFSVRYDFGDDFRHQSGRRGICAGRYTQKMVVPTRRELSLLVQLTTHVLCVTLATGTQSNSVWTI